MNAYESTGMAVAVRGDAERTSLAPRWIQSPAFDLGFFTLSPLIALPVLLVSPEPSLLSLTFACVLGIPHYLSTFVFFLWDETRAEHRARWPLFFGAPALIVVSLAATLFLRIPYVVQVVIFSWNAVHVARQSCGICSIYRHRAGVKDPSLKHIVNTAIMSTSLAMAFWDTSGHPGLHGFLTMVWARLPQTISLVAVAVAVVALARLALSLSRRFRSETPPRLPELIFLGTSLLLFHPYLWIRDSNQATLGMLLGHFIQYLGIVWLVHWRKFATAGQQQGSPTWLATLSTNLPLLIAVVLATGLISLALRTLPPFPIRAAYSGALLSLVLVHFYLDGLFWAFRRPEVRSSLGPYVLSSGPRV
jgi:hypothetical protein